MKQVSEELEALSRSIVDQCEVDWSRVSVLTRTKAPETIQGLQILGDIIDGFRHVQIAGNKQRNIGARQILFTFAGLNVVKHLGSGGHGDVFLAHDPILDLDVALKLRHTDSDLLAHQFIAEARLQARVRHPNVASVYGAALDGNRVGIWMERVRGESLAIRMARGPIPFEEIASIGMELCGALQAVHLHGLVHGDVKPENVLWEPSGRVVLADFGSASELESAHAGGVITCTLRNLAPEVLINGERSVASDIYALGVLLYRLIGGKYPYDGDSAAELLKEQQTPCVPLLHVNRHAPRAVCQLIDRCLSADSSIRPSNVREMARELGRSLELNWWHRPKRALATGISLLAIAVAIIVYERPEASWRNELTLYRIVDSESAPIRSGDHVNSGDDLQLIYESNEKTWLYVLDDDGNGQAAILFPVKQIDPTNPLTPNTKVVLPRAGAEQLSWAIGDDSPREELLVIASRVPQPTLDLLLAKWLPASFEKRAGTDTRSATTLVRASVPDAVSSTELQSAIEEAKRSGEGTVRFWRFDLPHDNN